MARIVDGRAMHGVGLAEFYSRADQTRALARKGFTLPRTANVATDADPVPARINPLPDGTVRWIAVCPGCLAYGRQRAEYVWLDALLFWCVTCGNAAVGGRWLRVLVPAEREEIEALLLARPDPSLRSWTPGQTVEQLREQNADLGVT